MTIACPVACPYGECRMVNLCKGDHCVREGLERDGLVLGEDGQLVPLAMSDGQLQSFPHA